MLQACARHLHSCREAVASQAMASMPLHAVSRGEQPTARLDGDDPRFPAILRTAVLVPFGFGGRQTMVSQTQVHGLWHRDRFLSNCAPTEDRSWGCHLHTYRFARGNWDMAGPAISMSQLHCRRVQSIPVCFPFRPCRWFARGRVLTAQCHSSVEVQWFGGNQSRMSANSMPTPTFAR